MWASPAEDEMTPHPLSERLEEPGPKRLLALDGGGLRGLVSLGYLAKIEADLRQRQGRSDLVLSDYFDLIGGTSTGAIIATLLALGWSVEEIRKAYLEMGEFTFKPKRHWLGPVGRMLGAKFEAKPLEEMLRKVTRDLALGSPEVKTGLLVVARRVETDSVWALVNVPGHKFYEHNKDMKLWQVVRASTAAPTYFKPHWIEDVGDGTKGVFVDGGVSMHNNCALQLLMVATLEGFHLQWPLGADNLLLCSVGTGSLQATVPRSSLRRYNNLQWLSLLMVQLMHDATDLNQTILQWMSRSPTAKHIDAQIEDLANDGVAPTPLLHYLRYDVPLEREVLSAIGIDRSEAEIALLREMSNTKALADFIAIGEAAAAALVQPSHFPPTFERRVRTQTV